MQPLDRSWYCLESIPGLCIPRREWQDRLGYEFPALEAFLRPTDRRSGSYPCPSPGGDGCPRRVIIHGPGDIVAVCGESPKQCETLELTEQDVVLYRFDVKAFCAELAALLEIEPRFEEVGGARHTWAVGVRSPAMGDDFLVYLTTPLTSEDLRQAVSRLVARDESRFLLLAPTEKRRDLTSRELLRSHGVRFETLKALVGIDDDGNLALTEALPEVFGGLEPRTSDPATNLFQRTGDVWKIRFEGEEISLGDLKGLGYLAVLLREPGREFHAQALLAAAGETPPGEVGASGKEHLGAELPSDGLDSTGPVLDEQTVQECRERLEDLGTELQRAEENRDEAQIGRLREEKQFIEEQLTSAHGLFGRRRVTQDPVKRLRDRVRNGINRALDKIREEHPALGRHLDAALARGNHWVYRPEPPVSWIA